jgi:CRP/FNR family transcriptional regulator, cyclic AMP receptor protein
MQPVTPTASCSVTGVDALARLGADVFDAWQESCLADLPAAAAERLTEGARLTRHAVGEPCGPTGDRLLPGTFAMVVDGLLRIYHRVDSREITVRYLAAGGLVGLSAVMNEEPAFRAEPLRDTVTVELQPAAFRAAMLEEPAVAAALCRHLYDELLEAQQGLAREALLPVRARVAGHLLNLAERRDRELVVGATPQRLARAVGSVREVVSRVLRQMEETGLVQRLEGHLVLLDTAALHRVWAGESGF